MSRSHRTWSVHRLPVIPVLTVSLSFLIATFAPIAGHAATWGVTQHGGRTTAQAGAFVARADDPSAVTYNPAGIARLDGFQLQLGADAQRLDAEGHGGGISFDFDETTDVLPAAYLTYRLPGRAERVVLGLGVDSPYWTSLRWKYQIPPILLSTQESSVELWQVHPVAAVRLTDRWSLGGGLRYVTGDLTFKTHDSVRAGASPGGFPAFEAGLEADGSADDVGFDLGLQYAAPRWGWGAVYRQGVTLTTDDPARVNLEIPGVPNLPGLGDLTSSAILRQRFELPDEIVVGGWFAPRPTFRLELDVAYADSSTNRTFIRNQPDLPDNPFSDEGAPLALDARDEAWSVRLGGEKELGARWMLSAGLAWEQSPTPSGRPSVLSPSGDAMVYAVGASYRLRSVTFDAGYSYWDYDTLESRSIAEDGFLVTTGAFESSEQTLSLSARWHF